MNRFLILLVSLFSVAAWADDGFKNESEVGVLVAKGNSDVQSISGKSATTYTFAEKNSFKLTAGYLRSRQEGVESAKAWNLGIRYERALSDHFSVFIGQSVDGDKFQGIQQRYATDLGGKYFMFKEEKLTWFAEAGYRYTDEHRTGAVKNFHYLRAYTELEKKWTDGVSTKYWLEYLPNMSESDDFQINTELSVNAALNSVFSLKTGYLVKFDNEPAPGVTAKSDRVLTTALVAKF